MKKLGICHWSSEPHEEKTGFQGDVHFVNGLCVACERWVQINEFEILLKESHAIVRKNYRLSALFGYRKALEGCDKATMLIELERLLGGK